MRLPRWAMPVMMMLGMVMAVAAQAPAPAPAGGGGQRGGGGAANPAMVLTSTAFPDGGQIPVKYSQAGEQVSPALTWTNTPPGTMSLVLHMHDMEGARNKTTEDQLHWLVWNIPATATGLPEGVKQAAQLADGSYQVSASGQVYRGPGAGAAGPMHHYVFEIYALDTKVDVAPVADAFETRANVLKAIQGHILGKAVTLGLFHRPQ